MESNIAVFKGKEIRKTIHNKEWWFVVEDVVLALIESSDSKQYIQRMKQRDPELGKGWVQIVHTLLIDTSGGKQKMNCANTEGVFRIIQSIPSPKAEPFKRWLAKVGYERVQEIEDPELGTKRTRALYKAKGYSSPTVNSRGCDHPLKSFGIGANSISSGQNLFLFFGPQWMIPFLQSSDRHSYFRTIFSAWACSGSKWTRRAGEWVVSPKPVPASSDVFRSALSVARLSAGARGAAAPAGASCILESVSGSFSRDTARAMVPMAEGSANTLSA
jgi:hypothetical protein